MISIDELMMDLNEEAAEPNIATLRRSCLRFTKRVYSMVDQKMERLFSREFIVYPSHDGVIDISDSVQSIIEVYQGKVKDAPISEIVSPRVQWRQDKVRNTVLLDYMGCVTVEVRKYPEDEEGNLIILPFIYEAVLAFSKAQYILHKLSKKQQWRDTLSPYREYDKQAERAIAHARSEVFKMTKSDIREFIRVRKGGFNGIV